MVTYHGAHTATSAGTDLLTSAQMQASSHTQIKLTAIHCPAEFYAFPFSKVDNKSLHNVIT